MPTGPLVTVLIPTFNAGPAFAHTLAGIQRQRVESEFEVLIIDSGSTDGTLEIVRQHAGSVRLLTIPHREFNHGLTRDLGVNHARGQIVVLLTQDALPADEHWLQFLIAGFSDSRIAGCYSRQIPRADASPFLRDRLLQWMPEEEQPRLQAIAPASHFAALSVEQQLALIRFDNVSAALRRSVALQIRFGNRRFGEDMAWAHRVLLAGHALLYEPRSRVVHSHEFSLWYEFKRAYLDHQNRANILGAQNTRGWTRVATRSVGDALHFMRSAARDHERGVAARAWWRARAIPFAFTQNLGQYLGIRSSLRLQQGSAFYRGIDRLLSRGV